MYKFLKPFSSFFQYIFLLFSGICLFFLFLSFSLFPYNSLFLKTTQAKGNHNTQINTASFLSPHDKITCFLDSYEKIYYYSDCPVKSRLILTSTSKKHLKITFLSHKGTPLSFSKTSIRSGYSFSIPACKKQNRIFIQFKNTSVKRLSFRLLFIPVSSSFQKRKSHPAKEKPHPAPSKINHSPTLSPANFPSPKVYISKKKNENLSTKMAAKTVLNPQFLKMKPHSTYSLTIKTGKKKQSAGKYTWLSTNSSVATVKKGKITTHKKGITIICAKDSSPSSRQITCLIRVL